MEKKVNFEMRSIGVFAVLALSLLTLVFASTPIWVGSAVNYTFNEGDFYYHNLSLNMTGFTGDVDFEFDTQKDINWTNASGTFEVTPTEVLEWINIYDIANGNLTINATNDNQTGFFIIPIQATNTTDDESAGTNFEFMVNATNDYPNFTSVITLYNLSQELHFLEFLNGSDEEGHYPLDFNITFNETNCTHSVLSGLNPNENCSLFDFGFQLTDSGNEAALMNFTPTVNHVGTYWANISVSDFGASCPHAYCDALTYEVNKTVSYYAEFNVASSLFINTSNCTGATLMEGQQFNCSLNITTRTAVDTLNLSSYAFFKSGGSYYSNHRDWFYANSTNDSSGFLLTIPISITPTKKEVGNWTINFTADDAAIPQTEAIDLYVNFTESNPSLNSISNIPVYENESFTVTAYDEDLYILDNTVKNEDLTFVSNESWVVLGADTNTFGTNYSTLQAEINYDYIVSLGAPKNYSVMINVSDSVGTVDSEVFLVEVYNDSAAEWNDTSDYVFVIYEDNLTEINLSEYVTDPEGDNITFSYSNDSIFDNFNLTDEGMINFTSGDVDVGYHNLTINASDGKLDSLHVFNFTVLNIEDLPSISPLSDVEATEDFEKSGILMAVTDDDFLIPESQSSFYDETLDVNITFDNLTVVNTSISYTYSLVGVSGNTATYAVLPFTPLHIHVGDYNVTVNVTDTSNNSDLDFYTLSINETNDPPILDEVSNYSFTIYDTFYLDVNSTDEEDSSMLPESGALNYSLSSFNASGDFLTIDRDTGLINLTLNSTYEGVWRYNLSVNDTNGSMDYEIFWLRVYGVPSLLSPSAGAIFNFTEDNYDDINLTLNHTVANNLTFEFWMDAINCTYLDAGNCSYSNFSLRDLGSYFGNGAESSLNFQANFTDETYGNLKNMTVTVYPNMSDLNSSQLDSLKTNFSFKMNVSHLNHVPEIYSSFGSHLSTYGESSPIYINLTDNIRDYDYLDSYYNESVNFTILTNASGSIVRAENYTVANRLPWNGTIENWTLELYGESAGTEYVTVVVNDSAGGDVSDPFTVSYVAPTVVDNPTPSPSRSNSGTTTKIKHYSLKVISPQDVIISDDNYIEVPFSVQNNGQLDLVGINLSSHVRFNNMFTEDIQISLNDAYIPLLKFGQSENFTMRIAANTQRSGKYKATIFANVTSPKFSDWGDFFIDLQRVNESEAEQILIFTEKMIADNPECLELTENLNVAQEAFMMGDPMTAFDKAQEVVASCEDAIEANDQIRYPLTGFVEDNFFYIMSVTLAVFLLGFVIYIYKRVRFNKSKINDYI